MLLHKYIRPFCFVLLVGALIVVPLSTKAIEYRGIGGQPANPRPDNPRSGSIFIYTLKPGESAKDGIIVRNGTDKAQNILVYPADSLVSSGGAFACEQKAEKADQVGSWITMEKSEVALPAQGFETVNFTITVPKNADVGEHNGCMAIQSGTLAPEKDVNGLTLSFRSAIRVAITVPGKISKSLDITSLKAQKASKSDKQGVQVVFRNRGNVSLDTDVVVEMKGLFGRKVDTITGTYAMLSGVSTELNFELKRPKIPWLYSISASAKYNEDPASPLGQQSSKTKQISKSLSIVVWPSLKQLGISLLALAIVFAIIFRFVYKIFYIKRQQKSARRYIVKKGESIETIAKKLGVSWYDIALLNNLKAPYKVQKGKRLYVPSKAKPRREPKLKKRLPLKKSRKK